MLTVTGTTSGKRIYISALTVYYEDGNGGGSSTLDDCDLALTNSPIALSFDLYNNASAQTISYTTSSTGAVTVSESEFVETEVDQTNKIITVTPKKKTSGAQEITVSQAADDNYKDGSAKFTVTITDSTPKDGAWVKTDLADLTADDVFVIVGDNGYTYAMSNDKGASSAPTAVAVTIEDDEITGYVAENIQWNISYNSTNNTYTFYPNGSTETWLYCTSSNNGVRVGTNESKSFRIVDDYLFNVETSTYLGIYSSQDWRRYGTINANITGQTFAFYKYVDNATVKKPVITVDATFIGSTTATITCATTGATIYYSYDGENWIEYTEALTITATTTIYAKAVVGEDESAVVSKTTTRIIPTPIISADNVSIAYDTTTGSIAYTLENEAADGVLTATTTDEWLTIGTVGTTVPFTCEANDAASARTATVTMTYTYNTSETVTKNVTVTQEGNPNVVNTISEITEVGSAYTVKGTVVATNSRGFVIGDGTGYVYTYLGTTPTVNVNDMVRISGTTGSYGHIIQFTNSATITEAVSSNYTGTPVATVITEVPVYTEGYHLSTYLEFEGTLEKNNSNYYISIGNGDIQISYPTTAQGTALTDLDGKTVHVKGYFSGINGNSYFTTMLESVEEVVSTDPIINADDVELAYDATSGEIEYTITNPIDGQDLTAVTTAEWISNITVAADKVTFTTTANEGSTDRTATITLSYEGAIDKEVTVKQLHQVTDYAILPFEYDGNGQGTLPDGLSQDGVGSYTSSSPYMKFDSTGDYLVLKLNEAPATIEFDIKGNSFSDGTFTIQISADGTTYIDLKKYKELKLNTVDTKTLYNADTNVRYIKWVYTEKVTGNVALGNIKVTNSIESFKKEITSAGYATLYAPCALDFTSSGLKAYIATVSDKQVTFNPVTTIPANTGVLLKGDEGNYEITVTDGGGVGAMANAFVGAAIDTEVSAGIFVLMNGDEGVGFYKTSKAFTIGAHTAYLPASAAPARSFIGFDFDDNVTTAIESMATATTPNGEVYNLQGQRIGKSQLKSGLYIVGGKKMLVK